MTTPGGGHGNDINLAALWIPVVPETSHMGEEFEKTGKESKRRFEQGWNSTGSSPEALGQGFGSRLQASINKEFKGFELPYGVSGFLDKFNVEVSKSTEKLRGETSQALRAYRQEYDNLTAATERSSQAEAKVALFRKQSWDMLSSGKQQELVQAYGSQAEAMERLHVKANILLPLISEQDAAQKNLTETHARAGAALEDYRGKVTQLSQTHEAGSRSGQIMAGIMGGAIVLGAQMAVHAVENLVEAVAEGFTKAVELTVELGKQAVELGEKYEHIGIQIHEFSTVTGEDFAKTEEAAQHVFSTLDVAGNDVGKTMAQLSSIMGVSGEEIQSLVRNVTELQGRYTTLKATDLGSSFRAFKVPAEEADSALASLLQSARGSGQDLGQLASALSGNVALTLHEAGLNIEQAGKFTADLMAMGEPGRQAMTGMAMAMKEFSLEGISFSDGMKLAGEKLNELGDTAAGQELAQKLFGARNWIVAKDAVKDYLNIISQAPDAFNATTASTQEFLDQTATLGNKVEEFKHKAEDAFKPFGEAAKDAAITGLNSISTWFSKNHHQIIGQIKQWGDKLIDFLPVAQEWGVDFIRIFGMVAQAMALVMVPVATTIGVAGAGMLALTGHFKEAGHMLEAVGKFDAAAFTGDIGLTINNFADKIQGIKIDTEAIHEHFDGAADAANRIPTTVGSGLGQGLTTPFSVGPGGGGSPGGGPSVSTAPGAWFPGTGGGTGGPTTGPGGGTPVTVGLGGSNVDARSGVKALARQMFPWPESEWAAFDMLEMKEAGYDPAAKNASGAFGVGQFLGHENDAYASGYSTNPATQLRTMFQYIADRYGTPSAAWAQYYQHPGGKGSYQHGGMVGFPQRWDPPVIDPGNPIQPSDYGSLNEYLMAINLANYMGAILHEHKGHQSGGAAGKFVTGGKGGKDDIPALLTKGEYVWDTDTVDEHGWLIKALHQGGVKGFDAGGGVLQVIYSNTATGQKTGEAGGAFVGPGTSQPGYYGKDWEGHTGHVHTSFASSPFGEFYGLPKGTDIRQGQSGFPAWVYTVGAAFGVEASTYAGHQEGSGYNRGIDWWPKGHADMSGSSYTPEEKQRLQNFASSIASYGVASSQAGTPSAWAATAPLSGGPRGGDYGPAQYPGMPGQYGGYGQYGGETADQQAQLAKAVREANDRKADLDRQVIVNQRQVDDLRSKLDSVAVSTKLDAFGKPYPLTPAEQAQLPEKRKKLNEQLDDATATLAKSQREAGEANSDIADATRKQTEGTYKKPSGSSTAQPRATGEAAFQQLGASFLSGIGQELGFGDLFSKPPWEWGAVKLLASTASWAMGTANAWADVIGKGGTNVTGYQPIPGWDQPGGSSGGSSLLSGLTGSLGIPLPKQGVSSGPNIVPAPQPLPPGQGGGPMSGPGVVNYDNSIHVASDVDPTKVLGPVQELANSKAAQAQGQTGGFQQ